MVVLVWKKIPFKSFFLIIKNHAIRRNYRFKKLSLKVMTNSNWSPTFIFNIERVVQFTLYSK